MKKTLGLDLGTNSIGWAIVGKEKGEETKLTDKGVLIFTEGVKSEKGIEFSRAAARTEKRSARRIKFRRKLRKYRTLLVLAQNNMCPLSESEVIEWRKSGLKKYPTNKEFLDWLKTDDDNNINPYHFRDRASRSVIGKLDLGRALYHMAQRRGFWSNRLDKSDEGIIEQHKPNLEDVFENAERLIDLHEQLDAYFIDISKKKSKNLDAGEKELKKLYNFFIKQFKIKDITLKLLVEICREKLNEKGNLGVVKGAISNLSDKIKVEGSTTLGQYFWVLYQRGEKIRDHYTDREKHYLSEFELICKVQDLDVNLIDELNKAIFYQRPLKSQKSLIGKCSLETDKARCSVSHPAFEEFRKLQFINSIKVLDEDGKKQFLTNEQRVEIQSLFFRKSKPHFDFSDISKRLKIDADKFNYDSRTTISGCPTSAALKLLIGDDWRQRVHRESFIDKKGNLTKKIYVYEIAWHVLFTFDSDDKLQEFADDKLCLSKEEARKFSKINLKKDYSSLSLKAINKILPYLREGLIYSHAVFMANMQNVVIEDRWRNQEDRELIQSFIKENIENHQLENKINFVINSCIENCKDNHFTYSKEAEKHLRDDLKKVFKNEFGAISWNKRKDKEMILEKSFEIFLKCLKSNKKDEQFVNIKRIDQKIKDFLKGENETGEVFVENEKLFNKMFHPSDLEIFKPELVKDEYGNVRYIKLGNPVTGSIKNPMAIRAMYQLRKIVNALIEEGKIDENTVINIELARELNDANIRKAIQNWQKSREELRKTYEAKIKELYEKETGNKINPTSDDIERFEMALEQREDGKLVCKEDILKYQLWNEQNHICLYTGKTIGLTSFLGKNPTFEIEHTIPRSKSYDNTIGNLTLADKRANNKKGNKTPFEIGDGGNGLSSHSEILNRIAHWKKKYEELDIKIKQKLRATKAATTKDAKDRIIVQRHELKLEYNYWKGKHDRFTMEEVPSGFARRQLTDIGIITKYSRAYLKSVFPRVYSVKGTMVAEFRKAWGLHDKDQKGNYIVKDRGNHTHHCKDAITIACMDKYKYDKMAEAWGKEEKGDVKTAREIIQKLKPWKTFAEDVRNIENEILVVHHTKDVAPIQTKKKLRKRGKIQFLPYFEKDVKGKNIPKKDEKGKIIYQTYTEGNKLKRVKKGDKIPMYQQGDTIRGSLHKDTFYGAIASKDKNGDIVKDKEGNVVPAYVERVKVKNLKKAQVDKIVDEVVKEKIKQAIKKGVIKFGKTTFISEEGVWMNKEKGVKIKKVRVFAHIKAPLQIKEQRDRKAGKEHKHYYYAANDENYCMAIYEGLDKKGSIKRSFEMVNMMDAADYFKLSNVNSDLPIVPKENKGLKYKGKLMAQKLVLFYEQNEEEIWDLEQDDLVKRLYRVRKMSGDGRVTFQYQQEARNDEKMKEDYKSKHHTNPPASLTNGISKLDFENGIQAKYLLSTGNMSVAIEGVDFTISPLGEINKIN
ncbi:MAG: type II CRISPR RNA-guided endonuclease Cas9 [Flavobacteriaceae bacterium]|nr:type II CRISPR RNA-guided endonuclease Cas9 [Flavobacteriaceae bacterium]